MHTFYIILSLTIVFGRLVLSDSQVDVQNNNKKCMFKLDLSVCYPAEQSKPKKHPCNDAHICKKQFNITYVKVEPYSWELVADLLRMCCGHCVNVSNINTFASISDVNTETINTSHFVFPVIGRTDATTMYGYHFISLVDTPGIYYIRAKRDDLLLQLILACFTMWPLAVICLFMVLISGFCGWITETWRNEEEFPRVFLIGWFEGIWWSFISMTTVGYGDKVPKSVPARLFSIAWIFIGIVSFSLVTAMLAAEITKVNNSNPPLTMAGSTVATLRDRLYESKFIASNGGVLLPIEPNMNITDSIHQMITMLVGKEIDGFVLDRYTLLMYYRHCEKHHLHQEDIAFLKKEAIRAEMTYFGNHLSYGILVKYTDDHDFLADVVSNNMEAITTCNRLMINKRSREINMEVVENPIFSTSGEVFWPSFIAVSLLLASILIFGVLYELHRTGWFKRKRSSLLNATHVQKTKMCASHM